MNSQDKRIPSNPMDPVTNRWNSNQRRILVFFQVLSSSENQAVQDVQRALQTRAQLPAVKKCPLDIIALDLETSPRLEDTHAP